MKTINIQCDGEARGTKVTKADGSPVHGVRSIAIDIAMNRIVTATVEILTPTMQVESAKPLWTMTDPSTGLKKNVRRIEFADGTVFEA